MSDQASTRPRQVTMGVWLACGASLALIFTSASTMTGLYSLAMRERLQKGFDEAGVQLDPTDALPWLKVAIYVAGAVAAVAFVSAIYAARRDRTARLLVTVCAVLVFVSGIFIDPILAAMVAVAATLLWSGPANDWFAGREVRTPSQPPSMAAAGARASTAQPEPRLHSAAAPLSDVFAADGTRPAASAWHEVPQQPRPRNVTLAGVITVVTSTAITVWLVSAAFAAMTDAQGELRKRFDADPRFAQAGIDYDTVKAMVVALMGGVALWALAAAVLGVLVLRGVSWSRMALIVSSSIAGAAAVLAGLASWIFLIPALVCVVVIGLIAGQPAADWFNQRRTPPSRP